MTDLFQVVQRLRQEQACPEIPYANTVPFLTAPSNFGVLANLYLRQELAIPYFEENIARATKKEQLSALIAYFPKELAAKVVPYTQGLVDNVESDAVSVFREIFDIQFCEHVDEHSCARESVGNADGADNTERYMGYLKDENARLAYLVTDQTGEITALNEELLRQLDQIDVLEAEAERLQKLTSSQESEIASSKALYERRDEQISAYNTQVGVQRLEIEALSRENVLLKNTLRELKHFAYQFYAEKSQWQCADFDGKARSIYNRLGSITNSLYDAESYLKQSQADATYKRVICTTWLAEAYQSVYSLHNELEVLKSACKRDFGIDSELQRIAGLSSGYSEAIYRLLREQAALQQELGDQRASLRALHCRTLEMIASISLGSASAYPADRYAQPEIQADGALENNKQSAFLSHEQMNAVFYDAEAAFAAYKDDARAAAEAFEKAQQELATTKQENAASQARIQVLEAEIGILENRLESLPKEAIFGASGEPEGSGKPGESEKGQNGSEPNAAEQEESAQPNTVLEAQNSAFRSQNSTLRELFTALDQQLADVSEATRENELEKPLPSELQAQFNELQGRNAETLIQYARAAAALENAQKDYCALARREKKPMLMQYAEMLKELAAQTQRNAALSIQVQNLQNYVVSLQSAQREIAALRASYCACQNALFLHENFYLQARRILGE